MPGPGRKEGIPVALLNFLQTQGAGKAKAGREEPLVPPRAAVEGLRATIPPWEMGNSLL